MTNCTTNLLIKSISLSKIEFLNIKKHISTLEWGIFLESVNDDHIDSRWSIYSAQPIASIQTNKGITTVINDNQQTLSDDDPFAIVNNIRTTTFESVDTPYPFSGGALGYIGYEQGYQLEKISNAHEPQGLNLPEMAIGFYDWALLYDKHSAKYYLLFHKTKQNTNSLDTLWTQRLNWLIKIAHTSEPSAPFKLDSQWSSNMSKKAYQHKFNRIQDYILSGDCYQINLTQRFQADYQGDEYQAYQALIEANHPPFAAYLRLPNQTILSVSPERFLKLRDGIVESKPIKGTRPRFNEPERDSASAHALVTSEKDRAENLMIVDLLRNDIGRVCQPGSVNVPKLFAVESFPAVHHLVSTVLGKLAVQYSSEDLLRACFPGGSITGAPKIRAMEIIAELEPNNREVYCGSIGYINGNGELDMNISIRTIVCHNQRVYCWAGGGLVADSNVDQEYQECFDKLSKILPCLAALNQP